MSLAAALDSRHPPGVVAVDYSFFALLFLLASQLAPDADVERAWVNARHPEQTISWTHEGDGWAMKVNGRDLGVFYERDGAIVHHTGQGTPTTHPFDTLARGGGPTAERITLLGQFAPNALVVERSRAEVRLVDPGRELLRAALILRVR